MENQALDHDPVASTTTEYAGFWTRVAASLIDGLIFLPFIVLNFVNTFSWKSYLLSVIFTSGWVIYKIIMEGTSGATLGKRAMSIKVITARGSKMTLADALQRNIIYFLGMLYNVYTTYGLFHAEGFSDVNSFMDMSTFANNSENKAISWTLTGIMIISGLFVIFDKRKQALHDKIGKTFVVKT